MGPFTADEAHPLYWSCRHCGADAGEPCRTRAGDRARGYHADRYDCVRLWRRYGQSVTR